ncbi:MAG: hypothetical protein CMN55_10225 [Sneathiella sp.]|mgnify:CR=1 FL=1|nr:hypothetical protein [Sneathiella sp.]
MSMHTGRNSRHIIVAITLLSLLSLIIPTAPARSSERFSFLAISDVPYSAEESRTLTQRAYPAIRASPLPFVLFLGDFKDAKSTCTDDLLTERRDQIMGLHPGRVFYTPGDNDWTDCDRRAIPEPMSELDRLDVLRRLFYAAPMPLPPEWRFSQQPLFPENMRWLYNNVLFATLHLVSTNNGREEILLDNVAFALTLTEARDEANLLWLDAAFTEAGRIDAAAVVIATQADITQRKYQTPCTSKERQKCDAFASINLRLRYLAARYAKPVLLIHGDTNPYCLDKGFGDAAAPRLWRLNSTGDYSFVDAAKITVDIPDSTAPFTVTSLTEKVVPQSECKSGGK